MKLRDNQFSDRFKSASWMELRPSILVAGMGGIGSNTLYNLWKTIPADYYAVDMDNVEDINVFTQFFSKDSLGKPKVTAVASILKGLTGELPDRSLSTINKKIVPDTPNPMVLPITISAFDNMTARRTIFEQWKNLSNREILLDGRLRATYYQVITVVKGREDEYEATLFEDGEIEPAPCTYKQTPHFGMLIGARITHILTNYLTNKVLEEEINVVPFMIEENGDNMYVNITM